MRGALFVLLPAVMWAQVQVPQKPAPRDASSQAGPSATVRGRVTERESGLPLPRFRVSVSRQPLYDENGRTVATAVTDANGVYEIPRIPPGTYLITARPPELVASHLTQMFGHDEPLPLTGALRMRTIDLKGDAVFEADIAVRRSLAIEGHVATEEGDPLADAQVTLERIDLRALRPGVLTDDRGFYRHYGLPPGRYRLCVTPSERTQAGTREALLKACYPADQDPANPSAVDVRTADVRNVNLVVRRGKRFSVSGTVVDGSGSPLNRGELSFYEQNVAPRRSLRVERPGPGRFIVRDVEPGSYQLRAAIEADADRSLPREFGAMDVTVGQDDVGGLVLQTRRPATISGVVIFEGGPPDQGIESVVVRLHQDPSTMKPGTNNPGRTVRKDLTFELSGVLEPVTIGVDYLPSGWLLRSVFYHGRDVTDQPVVLETSVEPRAIEITLTNRVAHISGRSVSKPPAAQAVIVLALSVGGSRGGRGGANAGATVARSALLSGDGTFKIGPLAPGEYFVVAADRDDWFDASLRDRTAAIGSVLSRAERVVVFEGDQPQLVVNIVSVK
jgi:protocatechuate 3,4-dioxygenase beta subunit